MNDGVGINKNQFKLQTMQKKKNPFRSAHGMDTGFLISPHKIIFFWHRNLEMTFNQFTHMEEKEEKHDYCSDDAPSFRF